MSDTEDALDAYESDASEDYGSGSDLSDMDINDAEDDDVQMLDEEDEEHGDDNVYDGEAEVLTPSDLLKAQFDAIEEVNNVLSIPAGTARNLLAHFNWNKERLMERYYGGDSDSLFEEAKCVNPRDAVPPPAEGSTITCEICFCDMPGSECAQLPCGHPFCQDCWKAYLNEKVAEQGTTTIECPAYGCNIAVDEYTVTKILERCGEEELLKKYHYLVAKAFVRGNRKIQWCPSPNCQFALQLSFPRPRAVRCKCGHEFCFACQEHRHNPLKCPMLRIWLKKCADDSETSNWISAHTKECPKCHSTIEKNGGCNHMTCNSCRHEFCWICLGAWEPHGSSWYNCNRFEEDDSQTARERQKESRRTLERYLFYFNRYQNHGQSLRLESKLWQMVEHKQREMQKTGMSWIEVQFLSKAVRALTDARTVLRDTYVFAYYLAKNNQCQIFENNQRDLEMSTENLSKYLEDGEAKDANFREMKQKVMDLSKYCEYRRKVLIDHIEEGYAKRFWLYNSDEVNRLMAEAGAPPAEADGPHAMPPKMEKKKEADKAPAKRGSASSASRAVGSVV